jgi:hypothetical protein
MDNKMTFDYVAPKDALVIKAVDWQQSKPSVSHLLVEFLSEKFPYHEVDCYDYTGASATPGDWKAPQLVISNKTIGWLQNNYTTFTPSSWPNARDEYQSLKLADPNFFDIFHKMAIYEFGYDPMKPGSREAYMGSVDFEDFNPDLMKIYHSTRDKDSKFKYSPSYFLGTNFSRFMWTK